MASGLRAGVGALFLTLVLSACGGAQMRSTPDPNTPTLTAEQAKERVEEYLQSFRAAFPAEATLELLGDADGACTDASGVNFDGRVQPGRTYWVRGLDQVRYDSYFDALKSWLPAHGWTVDKDARPQDRYLHAYRPDDGFTMSLQANRQGGLSIDASSPCVWPDGTPR